MQAKPSMKTQKWNGRIFCMKVLIMWWLKHCHVSYEFEYEVKHFYWAINFFQVLYGTQCFCSDFLWKWSSMSSKIQLDKCLGNLDTNTKSKVTQCRTLMRNYQSIYLHFQKIAFERKPCNKASHLEHDNYQITLHIFLSIGLFLLFV